MDCRETRERLSDFRDGVLPLPEAESVSRHIATCEACAGVVRSLDAVREELRDLPPIPAPPALLARVREAIAREEGAASGPAAPPAAGPTPGSAGAAPAARSAFSRMRAPLGAAAAVLLVASAYWYWPAARPTAPPVEVASSAAPPAVLPAPAAVPSPAPAEAPTAVPAPAPAPVQVARAIPEPAPAPAAPEAPARPSRPAERSIATLPEDTPDPKVRVYSLSDLPSSPVLRASTRFQRVLPASREEAGAAESGSIEGGAEAPHDPSAGAVQIARVHPPFPYGRNVDLDVAPEEREEAARRIGEAARRLGGTVEGTDRVVPEGTVAVRVLLPERMAPAFLDELGRIGKIPPEGMPARSVLPAGPSPGTNAYTVRLRSS